MLFPATIVNFPDSKVCLSGGMAHCVFPIQQPVTAANLIDLVFAHARAAKTGINRANDSGNKRLPDISGYPYTISRFRLLTQSKRQFRSREMLSCVILYYCAY